MTQEILPCLLSIGKYILATAALLLFYKGIFRKNATYTESRVFLLGIAICAVLVSQFRIAVTTPETKIIEVDSAPNQLLTANTSFEAKINAVTTEMKTVRQSAVAVPVRVEDNAVNRFAGLNRLLAALEQSLGLVLLSVYLLVAFILGLNLLIQYLGILKLKRKGKSVFKDNLRLVIHPHVSCPFSFGKTIFLPQNLKDAQLEVILEHESWHIRHKHYVDVLIQEISTCIFWFNPIQWLIRKELRSIHEFQADRSVLDKGCDLFRYQTIILEEVMGNHIRLANGFNQSFTKKRFIQMKNQEPSKLSAIRKLMLVPFLTLLFAAFCFVPGQSQVVKVSKTVTNTGFNGNTKTTTSVTSTDSIKLSMSNVMSGNQASNVLDSISILTEKVLPILKKLEKSDPSQNGELLDELFKTMDIKVNNRTVNHKDLSKEVLASLKPADYIEMEKFLNAAKDTEKKYKNQPQDQDNAKTMASMNLIQQFGKLGIVQKVMPDVLKLLGSMMNDMMQGVTSQISSSGRTIDSPLIGTMSKTTSTTNRESEPESVPAYINPYCKLSEDQFEWSKEPFGIIRVVSIERKSNETVVTLCIPIYYNRWIRFSNKTQLINTKNGDRYTIRRVENMPLNTEIFFHDVDRTMVLAKVVFPPLKKNVKTVDYIEFSYKDGSETEWSFRNLNLSDYKPGANKTLSDGGSKVYY